MSQNPDRQNSAVLGCIADDFTGATDLANTLVRQGMRTVQLLGVPDADMPIPDADAIVIALKSRTTPAADAIRESLAAQQWLENAGCQQYFFKYCSTFDSTAAGNIGPVADALLDQLGDNFTIACPAFPENARTVFKGYLFVADALLNESGMQNHPLTPMTDPNLVRVLASQTEHPVGLIQANTVSESADAIKSAIQKLRNEGIRHAIVDAITDDDLERIGEACADLKLITGGSGVALGLPDNYRRAGTLVNNANAGEISATPGHAAVLAGSCSLATLGQISEMQASRPSFCIDPQAVANGENVVEQALAFAAPLLPEGPVLIYSSASAAAIRSVQEKLGREKAGEMIEQTHAEIARALVNDHGVTRLVVAGGETSGAVVSALGIRGLRIGRQIDPGVPWTTTLDDSGLALALKSGNFGTPDFFLKSLDMLEEMSKS